MYFWLTLQGLPGGGLVLSAQWCDLGREEVAGLWDALDLKVDAVVAQNLDYRNIELCIAEVTYIGREKEKSVEVLLFN